MTHSSDRKGYAALTLQENDAQRFRLGRDFRCPLQKPAARGDPIISGYFWLLRAANVGYLRGIGNANEPTHTTLHGAVVFAQRPRGDHTAPEGVCTGEQILGSYFQYLILVFPSMPSS